MFNLAETCGVASGHALKHHNLFQRFERCLAQQDIHIPARRPLDDGLGRDAALGHLALNGINIQGARRQMVDMRPFEAHHIGNQPMRGHKLFIGLGADGRVIVPAEGFQRLAHKLFRLRLREPALGFRPLDAGKGPLGHDLALREDLGGLRREPPILDEIKPQQRGENAERVALERRRLHRTERGGMHRNPRDGEVVIADRHHPHHRKHPTDRRQFLRRSKTDRPVSFDIQTVQFARRFQPRLEVRIRRQCRRIHIPHEVNQRAILRHFQAIHLRHRG